MVTKFCNKCTTLKSNECFSKNKNTKDGLCVWCKQCVQIYKNLYKLNNQDIIKKGQHNSYIKNKQHYLDYNKQKGINAKKLVYNHYGDSCQSCGITDKDCLTIDHINGGGTQHRKNIKRYGWSFYQWLVKNNFPEGFQTLCMNCQRIKVIQCQENCKTNIKITTIYYRNWKAQQRHTIILYYGGCCVKCGYNNLNALEFDHIQSNGKEHRKQDIRISKDIVGWLKKQGLPKLSSIGLQLLCANCNHKKEKQKKNDAE